MTEYAVTIDIPFGISKGTNFGSDINAASDYFGDAFRGSYPNNTIVTFWENDVALDTRIIKKG